LRQRWAGPGRRDTGSAGGWQATLTALGAALACVLVPDEPGGDGNEAERHQRRGPLADAARLEGEELEEAGVDRGQDRVDRIKRADDAEAVADPALEIRGFGLAALHRFLLSALGCAVGIRIGWSKKRASPSASMV